MYHYFKDYNYSKKGKLGILFKTILEKEYDDNKALFQNIF